MIKLQDLKIEYFKSSGPGGQRKNKRFTAVKVTHLPTGITAVGQEQRSQAQNKEIALERLKEKVAHLTRKKKKRIPVTLPQHIKERILESKKKRSKKKRFRQKMQAEDFDL